MDAFWCITLSIILLRWWWKRSKRDEPIEDKESTDELISVIIPTINDK